MAAIRLWTPALQPSADYGWRGAASRAAERARAGARHSTRHTAVAGHNTAALAEGRDAEVQQWSKEGRNKAFVVVGVVDMVVVVEVL